jgi:hypothetical protein
MKLTSMWVSPHAVLLNLESQLMPSLLFLRRRAAGQYLKDRFGFGSEKTLAKLASVGGGPEFRRVGSVPHAPVIYEPEKLDAWALEKIGKPQRSTADGPRPAKGRHA